MPGLTFSNELISRDEGLHCDFACLLYKWCFLNQYLNFMLDDWNQNSNHNLPNTALFFSFEIMGSVLVPPKIGK